MFQPLLLKGQWPIMNKLSWPKICQHPLMTNCIFGRFAEEDKDELWATLGVERATDRVE